MSVNENDIREALASLDPENDEHWTKVGLPAIPAMAAICGEGVTRAMIAAIAPDFTRSEQAIPAPPASSAGRALADSAQVRAADPESQPVEPAEPEPIDDPEPAAEPEPEEARPPAEAPASATLEQRCARLELEKADLAERLFRAEATIARQEVELRARGGSRLDRALRARPRQQPIVPAAIRAREGIGG